MFSVFNRSRSPISLSAPRVEKSSFAADDLSTLRAAGRGTKMSGPKLEHVPEMHRPEGGFQHPLQLPRAVTSTAQKSSAAPDPTTAGNRRTTFEVPTNRRCLRSFLRGGACWLLWALACRSSSCCRADCQIYSAIIHLHNINTAPAHTCPPTFGNQGSQETLPDDCGARVTS